MRILAIEFSSSQRNVAVIETSPGSEPKVLGEASIADRETSGITLVERALAAAKWEPSLIDVVAVGLGPGSYTGIRAAIAVAQGWQLARGVRLLGISSVECLAFQAQRLGTSGTTHVVIDAQRGDVYIATYELDSQALREISPLKIASISEVQSAVRVGETVLGPEARRWFENGVELFPSASVLGELATKRSDYISGESLEPIYLRETSFVKAPPPRIR